MSSRSNINKALRRLLTEDNRIRLIGQNIRDPYGGTCKVTRGLSTKFGDRVIDTPIAEAGMIGMATGMSLGGLIPIVEIMFIDFLTLCVDQIYNIALKVHKHKPIKVIIRTMYNADQMYGPTHSQPMLWLQIPGVNTVRLRQGDDVYAIYKQSIQDDYGVHIIVEDKRLY